MPDLIKTKVLPLLKQIKTYWKTPPEGRYMPFKEIASLSFGGIGIKLIYNCVSKMILATTNTLIGNTIGIDPQPLYIIYVLSILSNIPLTALRANMIDNTRSMKGKYRPYILSMAVPTAILGIGFVWMPYENMSLFAKCVTVLLFNIGFQFFFNFMNDSYDGILNVLSPNTIERTDVSAVKMVVENLSPSIMNIIFPLIANAIVGENQLYDLRVFRAVYPVLLVIGVLISIPVYTNTKEKIIQAKTHVIQISFLDALRSVMRNKYFWIISLAGWLGFLEGSFASIIEWMYNYQKACSPGQYAIIIAISGNAAFWPNLLAPLLIRKYGKKKILVSTNLMSIGLIALMMPILRINDKTSMIWIMLLVTFMNTFMTCMGHFLNPSIQADIRDYQQYVTGERIDGMFAAVGLIGSAITLATSSVLPTIYSRAGINRETALALGYDPNNVYEVLYDPDYFLRICTVILIASAIGAAMNVLPFFFYDLTENRQRGMVSVLKIRAMFEDYGNGILNPKAHEEAINIIDEAKEYSQMQPADTTKDKTKSKKELKQAKELNSKIEIANFVMQELNRFETPEGRDALQRAKRMVEAGLDGFNEEKITLKQARAMPKETELQKRNRSDAIATARKFKVSQKAIKKHYKGGLEVFDVSVFDKLFAMEDKNEADLHETAFKLKQAKEAKNRAEAAQLKAQYRTLRDEKLIIKGKIKKATNQNSIYHRAAAPYLEAVRTVSYSENLKHYNEIKSSLLLASEQ